MLLLLILLFLLIIIISVIFLKKSSFEYSKATDSYTMPVMYRDLISKEEGDYILSKASSEFKTSSTLSGVDLSVRKSETMWIYRTDPIIKEIYSRLSKQFKFDPKNAEDLQVVKYPEGGYYREHHDSCCDDKPECEDFVKKSGQRVLTILIYLNDAFEEGSTRFPTLNLDIKPPKYGGVVFHPLEDSGNRCHPYALHTGTNVKSGTKYICNIWVREKEW